MFTNTLHKRKLHIRFVWDGYRTFLFRFFFDITFNEFVFFLMMDVIGMHLATFIPFMNRFRTDPKIKI